MRMRHFFNGTQWPINVAPSNPSSSKRYSGSLVIAGQSQPSQNDARPFEIPKKSPPKTIQILLYLVVWLGQLGWWHSQHMEKLHRHRPQIEKISETFFHAASMGQWYSGCLDKQISQHLLTQLTWANILWKRVLFCLVEWSKWWCVWTQRFACRIDITEVASKKKCFSLPPTISNLGTLKSHLKAILVPNDSSKSGNFHASVLLGFA